MKMAQAWGWLAAGVLAAGLNASYHDGGLQVAHQVADRMEQGKATMLGLASGQAGMLLTEARLLTARNDASSCPLSRAVARVQAQIVGVKVVPSHAEFENFEAISVQQEAQLARLDARRARIEARLAHLQIPALAFSPVAFHSFKVPVVCPRVRVNIAKPSMMRMPAIPVVHVEMAFAGPI